MPHLLRISLSVVAVLFACGAVNATAEDAEIKTSDTHIRLRAGTTAPMVLSVGGSASQWPNREPEPLISWAKVDGKRTPLHWHFDPAASRVSKDRISYVYESATPRLQLRWEWRARAAFGPIEHQIRIRNLEPTSIWIPLQSSLMFAAEVNSSEALERWSVEKGADTPSAAGTHRDVVLPGYSWMGRSSTYAHPVAGRAREIIPWMLITRADGRGWYAGVEFSGNVRLSTERDQTALRSSVSLDAEEKSFRTRIEPDKEFATPEVFVGAFHGGIDGAGNSLRPWIRQVLNNPATWADAHYPLIVNNSWGSGMAVDDALAHRMISDSAELGAELFGLDAGWFRGVGDWFPNPKKFPHGLRAIADDAHAHHLKFGIWVDWAQAGTGENEGALNVRDPKVRDWLVSDLARDWRPEEFKGQSIDIGVPAAREWVAGQLERMVHDFHLDMLEHDGYIVAQGCVRKDHPHAPPDPEHTTITKDAGFLFVNSTNSADVSYHATRGYYDLYEHLRAAHPKLLLEICNDGGRMVDFGSAAHGDYFSITDTYDPLSNRRAFYDASYVLPPAMLESYVERWNTQRIENFRYMLRSGMMGWLSIMQDTTAWSQEQHDVAKEELGLYKSALRPLIRDADLYHISDRPDGIHWDAIEYFDRRTARGVVYAFHGSEPKETQHVFRLAGLDAEKRYRLTFHDHSAADRTVSGAELIRAGVRIVLPVPNSSELIFLQEVATK